MGGAWGGPVAAVRKSRIPGALDAHRVSAKTKTGAHLGTRTGDCTDTQTLGCEPSPFVTFAGARCANTVFLTWNLSFDFNP